MSVSATDGEPTREPGDADGVEMETALRDDSGEYTEMQDDSGGVHGTEDVPREGGGRQLHPQPGGRLTPCRVVAGPSLRGHAHPPEPPLTPGSHGR